LIRGRTEFLPAGQTTDDFWSWRDAMYRAAGALNPDELYVASRQAFIEMALAGITAVGEFHYLHRDPAGNPYADSNELAKQVIRAARDVGLRIALLRVAYQRAGFRSSPQRVQRRFFDASAESFCSVVARLRVEMREDSLVSVGCAPHSVRAVSKEWLQEIGRTQRGCILHMHVAEQQKEVEACLQEHNLRPVQLLEELGLLGSHFTAVHAIYLSRPEINALARSGASVCACPTTEKNLGDGILQADVLSQAQIPLCLGSDSQATIDLLLEARELEGHLRLLRLRRAALDSGTGDPSGLARDLLKAATIQGARALGLTSGELKVGSPADFFTVDWSHPSLLGASGDRALASLIFAAEKGAIRDVAVAGRLIVQDGQHRLLDESASAFRALCEKVYA